MSAFDRQVGGDHYRDMAIQPFEFIERNGLSFGVGNVIKYLCRYKAKDGIEDLRKAKHYIDLLIDLELNHDKDDLLDRLEVIEVGDVTDSSEPGWTDRLT
tara:strand:+ start:758 stop:1057 length:300 start_codon:yes stop_codon:yes gene_type:complete